ncbi:MAG TPA: hypothetical protein VGO11_17765 [Chthoniobacteraceae bacterium]|jgi:hypothetical protein|nr:hypothetical protein [Chthoniobacteraceae bacterium]
MSWFQLDPPSIADRARAANTSVPSLAGSLLLGTLGFMVVSVVGFVPWAAFAWWFRPRVGEGGLYAACALAFIAASAPVLHRLLIGPANLARFYKLFGATFAAYALAWSIGWFALEGHPGSVVGLLAGAVVMGGMLALAFDAKRAAVAVIASIFVLSSIGYFIGGELKHAFAPAHPVNGRLLWGVAYGLGFGAGIGLAFHLCQSRARALLRPSGQ